LGKTIRIKILDHEYLIRTDEEEEEVQSIAQFVNEKFREVTEKTDGLSDRKRAILVAFDIASDYFQMRKACDNLRMDIENRARVLNSRLDDIVQ